MTTLPKLIVAALLLSAQAFGNASETTPPLPPPAKGPGQRPGPPPSKGPEDKGPGRPAKLPPEVLRKYDLNSDGVLDRAERLALLQDRISKNPQFKSFLLSKFDHDHNGELSTKELEEADAAIQDGGRRPPRNHTDKPAEGTKQPSTPSTPPSAGQ